MAMRLTDLNAASRPTAPEEGWTPDRRFLDYKYAPPTPPRTQQVQAPPSESISDHSELRAGLAELERRMLVVGPLDGKQNVQSVSQLSPGAGRKE